MDSEPKKYVYVLLCEGERFYVGKTEDMEKRYDEHLRGKGSQWTRIYKPIDIVELYMADTCFAEENKTKEYMIEYGLYKVRGGPYSMLYFSDIETEIIRKQLWHAQEKCFQCGGDHFVSGCKTPSVKYCCRCGRDHWASECQDWTDIEGIDLPKDLIRH